MPESVLIGSANDDVKAAWYCWQASENAEGGVEIDEDDVVVVVVFVVVVCIVVDEDDGVEDDGGVEKSDIGAIQRLTLLFYLLLVLRLNFIHMHGKMKPESH